MYPYSGTIIYDLLSLIRTLLYNLTYILHSISYGKTTHKNNFYITME